MDKLIDFDNTEGKSGKDIMVDKVYEIYEELNGAADKGKLEDQYRTLLQAVQDGEKVKGLVSQFIARFAEYFPHLAVKTVNALFDLCEDEDVAIRKQAEKDLVIVCKKLPNLVSSVADIFGQILQTDNASELSIVQNSLMSLFYINPEAAIVGLFAQITTGDSLVRDRCFKFLQAKYKNLGPEVMTADFEKCLFKGIGQILKVVETREQFLITVDILTSTKMAETKEGRNRIVEMIEAMLNIKKSVYGSDREGIAKLLFVVDFVFQYFHEETSSAPFFTYFCTRVLPKIRCMAENNENDYFSVLKMTVELSLYITTTTMAKNQTKLCLNSLLNELESFLFEPPKNSSDDEMPLYNFSFIESILYVINRLVCLQPKLLDEAVKSKDDLQSKIAYLLRASVPYKSKLLGEMQALSLSERRNQLVKIICLRALANISIIGKVLYNAKSPTNEKVKLSWKVSLPSLSACPSPIVPTVPTRKVTLVKRNRVEENDILKKTQENQDKRIYQPPNGKYSGSSIKYDDDESSARSYKGRGRQNHYARSTSRMERYLVKRRVHY